MCVYVCCVLLEQPCVSERDVYIELQERGPSQLTSQTRLTYFLFQAGKIFCALTVLFFYRALVFS